MNKLSKFIFSSKTDSKTKVLSKKNLYKNAVLTVISGVLLIVVTFAWFMSSKSAHIETISASLSRRSVSLYEAQDIDRDGSVTGEEPENYLLMSSGTVMQALNLMPGERKFYMFEATPGSAGEKTVFYLMNIQIDIPSGSEITVNDILSAIEVRVKIGSEGTQTISTLKTLVENFHGGTVPASGICAKVTGTIEFLTADAMNIYYEFGLKGGESSLHQNPDFSKVSLTIDDVAIQEIP